MVSRMPVTVEREAPCTQNAIPSRPASFGIEIEKGVPGTGFVREIRKGGLQSKGLRARRESCAVSSGLREGQGSHGQGLHRVGVEAVG